MEKGTKDNPHTILSSMEDIVVKAKEHGLDEIFYSESENSMNASQELFSCLRKNSSLVWI